MKNLFRIVFHIIIMWFIKKKITSNLYCVWGWKFQRIFNFSTIYILWGFMGCFLFLRWIYWKFFFSSCMYNIPNWIYIVKIIDIGLYSKYTQWRYLLLFFFLYTLHYYRILKFIYFMFDREFVEFALNNLIGFMLNQI